MSSPQRASNFSMAMGRAFSSIVKDHGQTFRLSNVAQQSLLAHAGIRAPDKGQVRRVHSGAL
jgi:hypothetical protein